MIHRFHVANHLRKLLGMMHKQVMAAKVRVDEGFVRRDLAVHPRLPLSGLPHEAIESHKRSVATQRQEALHQLAQRTAQLKEQLPKAPGDIARDDALRR